MHGNVLAATTKMLKKYPYSPVSKRELPISLAIRPYINTHELKIFGPET